MTIAQSPLDESSVFIAISPQKDSNLPPPMSCAGTTSAIFPQLLTTGCQSYDIAAISASLSFRKQKAFRYCRYTTERGRCVRRKIQSLKKQRNSLRIAMRRLFLIGLRAFVWICRPFVTMPRTFLCIRWSLRHGRWLIIRERETRKNKSPN